MDELRAMTRTRNKGSGARYNLMMMRLFTMLSLQMMHQHWENANAGEHGRCVQMKLRLLHKRLAKLMVRAQPNVWGRGVAPHWMLTKYNVKSEVVRASYQTRCI